MCATPYFLHDTFAPFESQIRARFARAVDDTNLNSDDTAELVIVDKSARLDQYEAEFGALVNPDRVQITWNGIASLWACGQGLGRLARRMFEAQRAGAARLYLDKDPELAKGLYFYELSRRLAKNRFDRWVDWLPFPDATPSQKDDQLSNKIYCNARCWIIRHELSHVELQHHARIDAESMTRYEAEIEADKQASKWIKDEFKADHSRPATQKPSTDELELEWRALAAGVWLLWVGLFEEAFHAPSPGYPAIAERVFCSFGIFDLAEDSFASEIFSYSVKAWIDPQGDWGVPANLNEATAKAAFTAAVIRLHRHMGSL